ncbi:MAG: site-specific integrase, partial [bacterium]|nr:site-specific integrase [bacterium]
TSMLDVDRALTPSERRRLLDAADALVFIGGRSKNRKRYKNGRRPVRKGYRPYRNRAIIYILIETGMRRGAVAKVNLDDVDFKTKSVTVEEKGGVQHRYKITNQALETIEDYIIDERDTDFEKWGSRALFLAPFNNAQGKGRLSAQAINEIWKKVCNHAGVEGKTPHSARHAMGKHLMGKTGNIAAVQRQLGHKNVAYSVQYTRTSDEELERALNDR